MDGGINNNHRSNNNDHHYNNYHDRRAEYNYSAANDYHCTAYHNHRADDDNNQTNDNYAASHSQSHPRHQSRSKLLQLDNVYRVLRLDLDAGVAFVQNDGCKCKIKLTSFGPNKKHAKMHAPPLFWSQTGGFAVHFAKSRLIVYR